MNCWIDLHISKQSKEFKPHCTSFAWYYSHLTVSSLDILTQMFLNSMTFYFPILIIVLLFCWFCTDSYNNFMSLLRKFKNKYFAAKVKTVKFTRSSDFFHLNIKRKQVTWLQILKGQNCQNCFHLSLSVNRFLLKRGHIGSWCFKDKPWIRSWFTLNFLRTYQTWTPGT